METNEIINKYIGLRPLYKKLAANVSIIIEELLELHNVNFHAVNYRAKTVESFSEKIKKPKYTDPLIQLTDFAGIRIIGYVEDDVNQIAKIIEANFEIDKNHSLDKSLELGVDRVGYKSVHYVCTLPKNRTILPEFDRFKDLKFEIQIRTILQHSWAEIEHDKNYKFSGELPPEIQRRFKLVAGSLELADREFNQLSREIDNYSKTVQESAEKGDLDIKLNSTALKQFLTVRFEKLILTGLRPDFNGRESYILGELRRFGIKTLSDLDKIIDKRITGLNLKGSVYGNFLGLVRNIMMLNDLEKYFTKSHRNDWGVLDASSKRVLAKLGVDTSKVEEYLSNADK
ncbi:hypothetical protein [Fluviicola sp.]|uniref:GTP pyrophosphokinase n=1 Tax=Fluviicola sp. TaxID=1917219 RepID=UPI0031D6099D